MAAQRTIPRSRQAHAALPASPHLPRTPHPNQSQKALQADGQRDGAGAKHIARALLQATASEWILVLSLIFGGCCSNAWALELSTTQLPSSGTLITFAQFLTTTLFCLPSHLYYPSHRSSWLPHLRPRAVPLSRWIVQVAFYFSTSLLNNMAFACHIPMPVHIVFRSGGLVINMILGYFVQKRSYTPLQVASVLLVTAGVISSTLYSSSSSSSSTSADTAADVTTYLRGVLLLLFALILTGLMGLWQERTFHLYGRSNWRESLFYSHLLSLPMFLLRRQQLLSEIRMANATPAYWVGIGAPPNTGSGMVSRWTVSFLESTKPAGSKGTWGLWIPSFYVPLALNVLTQLLCISGVNNLTSKVTSLTVTLVLVVRKAVSLIVSVMLIGDGNANPGLWLGAATVLLGTVGYSLAASRPQTARKGKTA
ncbi:golgi uridine diphosphate-N-acetylglucosamine transporter [Thecaphora frezii]